MAELTLAWEYLTGYAVATDPASRERSEWPPHPARVFMAMAAAWFETSPGDDALARERDEHESEGEALRWLETLPEPQLYLPSAPAFTERSTPDVYVPVNDRAGPSAATLQCVPSLTRSKQPRTFPRRHVGHEACCLHWPEADGMEHHREALHRACGKVTRIGHSSSMVRMWLADTPSSADQAGELECWAPDDALAEAHCRWVAPGFLDNLPDQTRIAEIEAYAWMVWRVQDARSEAEQARLSGDAASKKAANKASKEADATYEQRYGKKLGKNIRKSLTPPTRLRPKTGLWSGYRRVDSHNVPPTTAHSHFDTDLLILTHESGPALPVVSTLAVAKSLRGAVMHHSGIQPAPGWVSGHQPDNAPAEDEHGHMAILPLPFVGHEHADGHLLGMALAFPREGEGGDRRERGKVLGPLLLTEAGEPQTVDLQLGKLGVWRLCKRDPFENRRTLAPETWTAQPAGATVWASVTPVVLDKFPKADHSDPKQREAWEQGVRAILASACTRIGLPNPIHIDIDTTSWHRGSPRAVTKRRRLRGSPGQTRMHASLGDGFPDYPAKDTNAPRPQVHVFLRFAEPVVGPILLGVGRYRGYGLFKPLGAPT